MIEAAKIVRSPLVRCVLGSQADRRGPIEKHIDATIQVLKNLQTALKSQGADFANVVRITIYTTDVDAARTPEAAAIRAKYFAKNLPASTLVGVTRLASPDYKIEIEATAVLP